MSTTPSSSLFPFRKWLSIHRELMRDGVWWECVGFWWKYQLSTWRCFFFGHKWGEEKRGYEDAGYSVHVETWRECERKNCSAYEETWSIYGPARGVMG